MLSGFRARSGERHIIKLIELCFLSWWEKWPEEEAETAELHLPFLTFPCSCLELVGVVLGLLAACSFRIWRYDLVGALVCL